MYHYERSIHIRAPLAQLFEFHLNPYNLRLVSPSWVDVLSVEAPEQPVVGGVIVVDSKVYGMKQHWEVEWQEIQPPHNTPAEAWVVDVARKSPFPFWRHRHYFHESNGMVEMRDEVDYMPPFGMLGQIFHYIVVKEIEVMFFARQKRTKEILEAAQNITAETKAVDLAAFDTFLDR